MNELIQKLSTAIRESIKSIVELQKRAEVDDKLILSEVSEKLIGVQGFIAEIQGFYQEILNAKESLQKRVEHYEQWREDESKYQSFRFFSGSTVVVPKAGDASPYTKEWYCKHCFDNKKKSQLQAKPNTFWEYFCPECKTPYYLAPRDQEAYNEANQVPRTKSAEIVERPSIIPPEF
jgi:thymidylate synthase